MCNQVPTVPIQLSLISDDSNIFNTDSKYIIPLYQRAFAWDEKEIIQLINDIYYIEDSYFLGSLIVSKKDDVFEVVDGQQRLTALYLLLKSLDIDVNTTPSFECREKSNYTLNNINNLLDDKRIDAGIQEGKKIIDQKINSTEFNKEVFMEKLKKVLLYRIEVPKNTDLNRYFEIMNTRGEQLEQHDILKAKLMEYLQNDSDKTMFAEIWDACSDMTGYIQMHFSVDARNRLFGNDWISLPALNFDDNTSSDSADNAIEHECKISNLIEPTFKIMQDDGFNEDNHRVRFESIIEFPYFLLHTLKVFIKELELKNEIEDEKLVDQLLDDKKLLDTFNRVIKSGIIGNKIDDESTKSKEMFSQQFISYLLKCRFLFDKYVIKREFTNDNLGGVWSLKELKISGQGTLKKPYYTNTYFGKHAEWVKTWEPRTEINLMLQSCLRVSYTSPKSMSWITSLLLWLTEDDCYNLLKLNEYEVNIEKIAKAAVSKDFLGHCEKSNPVKYNMGVNTPHLVFNYLDYLLWKETKNDFVFEFRNSVEHWYPQNPSAGTFDYWSHDEGVDGFGNLCIIQRNLNSKFSNLNPEAKKSTFKDMIAKGSLKLRIMADKTTETQTRSASFNWKEDEYKLHEEIMIAKLVEACK